MKIPIFFYLVDKEIHQKAEQANAKKNIIFDFPTLKKVKTKENLLDLPFLFIHILILVLCIKIMQPLCAKIEKLTYFIN